ncbi:MAG TPA: protein TolQ [Rhizomicrobium sp.]|nr:protein TolQ [Rhizomicrobium sp.]
MMSRFAAFLLLFLLAAPAFAQAPPTAAPTQAVQTEVMAAPEGVIDASGEDAGPTGIAIIDTFLRADIVVQSVMVLLLLASLWSWTIIFNKSIAISGLKRKAKKFEKVFWSGQSLDELYQQFASSNDHPMSAVFVSALREWRRGFEGAPLRESQLSGIKERIEKAMNVTILRETDGLERHLGQLATIGSVTPFVGLLGTVWGIMNSFTAIGIRHDTSLAAVAPGISEALFATAAGLFAAIPAVIFYNRFVAEIGRYTNQLDAFADEFSAILSRQLDEKAR